MWTDNLPLVDPEIAEVLRLELERQQRTLEMIASENFAPQAVLECQGSTGIEPLHMQPVIREFAIKLDDAVVASP